MSFERTRRLILDAAVALLLVSCARTPPPVSINPPPELGQANASAEPSAGVSPYMPVSPSAEDNPAVPAMNEPESEPLHIRLAFTGDVLLYGRVAKALDEGGHDAVIQPELAGLLAEADLAFVNFEMSVSERGKPMEDKEFTFRGKPGHLPLIADTMGIDAVSLANNHSLDYGMDAFLDTMEHLEEAGIGYAGAGHDLSEASAPWVAEAQGHTIALLAASRVIPVTNWNATDKKPGMLTTYDPANLNAAIEAAKAKYDYVVVFVHWGKEGATEPEDYQVKLARGYVDAGADAVIGSHPHVLQGYEIYQGKPIAYSLGNFIFTSSHPETCVAVLNITEEDLWLEVVPCTIDSPYTSIVSEPDNARQRLDRLEKLSDGIYFDEQGRLRET